MEQSKSYTIGFLPDALNDITEIVSSFVMLGSRQGAKRIRGRILKAANQIQTFPYSGMSVPDDKLSKSGFRMILIENYIMFYKIFEEDDTVTVYRILNGRRDYPSLMRGLYETD